MIFIHFIPCVLLVLMNYLLYSGMKKAEMRKNRLMSMSSRTRSTSIVSTSEVVIMAKVDPGFQYAKNIGR